MLRILLLGIVFSSCSSAAEPRFNRDVRPILSDRCFSCHGPDPANRKANLRLDTEDGATKDLGKGRRAVVGGDVDRSELIRRVDSTNKALRMPPAYAGHDALPPAQIEILRQWIAAGALWEKHWAYLTPEKAELPRGNATGWAKNEIDRFVLWRLEGMGLKPSAEAAKATLLRRVTLDLTGLPPTPEEVKAFLADTAPDAYERVVDRLLASPRHAERMAIRWLDAARYADTNGYQTDGNRTMWRWRDWVVDAYRSNMPYDRFITEQIAGDLLPNATLSQKIATGFQRNHRTNAEGGIVPEEFRVEYVADRAETTATVFLGMTLGCARCHDHKYDPLTQRDFYSMFAFYNLVPEKGLVYNWDNDEPLIAAPTPEQEKELAQLDAGLAAARSRFDGLQSRIAAEQSRWEQKIAGDGKDWTPAAGMVFREELAKPEQQVFDGKRQAEFASTIANFNYLDPFSFSAWINPASANGAIVSHNEDYFEGGGHGLYLLEGKLRLHVIFRWTDIGMRVETRDAIPLNRWQQVTVTYDGSRYASGVKIYVDGQPLALKVLFDELNWPMSFKVPFRIGAGGGIKFKGQIRDVRVYSRALHGEEAATLACDEDLGAIASKSPTARTEAQAAKLKLAFLDKYAPEDIRRARIQLEMAEARRQIFYKSLPTVMVLKDEPGIRQTFLLKRGAYDAPGDPVTAATPGVLPPMRPDWPVNRYGLALWLTAPENPLTGRVAVNRLWQMLFGTGLVKTSEDFGSQGEPPTHQDLLDWLAVDFRESGWDVRHTLRKMVTSATYRQSSVVTPGMLQQDPENRWLTRGPRLRLAPEILRDQALFASGLLVEKVGGPSVKPYQPPGLWQELAGGKGYVQGTGEDLYRRGLYTFWKRTVAPPSMVNFDAPTREFCTVRESRTNTPLQALNLMNDVTFLEASRKLAERMIREGGASEEERLRRGYLLVLAREPKPEELTVLREALSGFASGFAKEKKQAKVYLRQGDAPAASKAKETELAAWSAVANLILNLDEAVTRE